MLPNSPLRSPFFHVMFQTVRSAALNLCVSDGCGWNQCVTTLASNWTASKWRWFFIFFINSHVWRWDSCRCHVGSTWVTLPARSDSCRLDPIWSKHICFHQTKERSANIHQLSFCLFWLGLILQFSPFYLTLPAEVNFLQFILSEQNDTKEGITVFFQCSVAFIQLCNSIKTVIDLEKPTAWQNKTKTGFRRRL